MDVYVLGDYGTDSYHVGRVRGLSAEVPIPILDIVSHHNLPAMAGNVASNLRSLGAPVVEVHSTSVDCRPIKNRLVTESGVQLARWDVSDTCDLYTRADLVRLRNADAVVVADYGKGSMTRDTVEMLQHLKVPLFVDTKQNPIWWVNSDAILFPNLSEYRQFEEEYKWIHRVVLKLGKDGIAYLEYGKVIFVRPSYARSVACVNGAGDTVIAGFALATLIGFGVPQAVEFASAAAAIVVEQPLLERSTTSEAVLERLLEIEYASPDYVPPIVPHPHPECDCGECAQLLSVETPPEGQSAPKALPAPKGSVQAVNPDEPLVFRVYLPSNDHGVN